MIATPSANLKTTTTPRAYDGQTSLYLPTMATIVDVKEETKLEKIFYDPAARWTKPGQQARPVCDGFAARCR